MRLMRSGSETTTAEARVSCRHNDEQEQADTRLNSLPTKRFGPNRLHHMERRTKGRSVVFQSLREARFIRDIALRLGCQGTHHLIYWAKFPRPFRKLIPWLFRQEWDVPHYMHRGGAFRWPGESQAFAIGAILTKQKHPDTILRPRAHKLQALFIVSSR
jgi:hypothetical protein